MESKQLRDEKRSLILLGAAVTVLALTLTTAAYPMLRQARANEEQLQVLRNRVAAYKQLAAAGNYEEQHARRTEQLELLRSRLPERLEGAGEVQRLYALAASCGVRLTAVNLPKQAQEKERFLPIQVSIKGSYPKVLNFITGLEQQGAFTCLEKLVLKGNEADGSAELSVQTNIYRAQR